MAANTTTRRRRALLSALLLAPLTLVLAGPSEATAAPAHRAVQRLSCTRSKAVFKNPLLTAGSSSPVAYTGIQAVQRGQWLGSAFNGVSTMAAISWSPGHRVRVLGRYRYAAGVSFGFGVQLVGVTPVGAVVGGVQRTNSDDRIDAVAWYGGHQHRLREHKKWVDVRPLAVTKTGAVVGEAVSGSSAHQVTQIVRWASVTAKPVVLKTLRGRAAVVAGQNGDVAWSVDGTAVHVRLASGRVRALTDSRHSYSLSINTAADHYLFANSEYGVVRWDLSQVPSSGPLVGATVTGPENGNAYPAAAGRSGAFIDGAWGLRHLQVSSGARGPLSGEYDDLVGEAIDASNTVAYTMAKDHLVHLMTCY